MDEAQRSNFDSSPPPPDKDVSTSPPKRKYYIERNPGEATTDYESSRMKPEERLKSVDNIMSVLASWPNMEDVWPFQFGLHAVAIPAGATGLLLNTTFRRALVLGHYSRASSVFAMFGLPAVTTAIFHYAFITRKIVSGELECPVCLQVNSALFQAGTGILYPLFLAPLVSLPTASATKNFYLPKVHKQPKQVLGYVREIYGTLSKSRFTALCATQIIVAMGVTHFEQDCYLNKLLPVALGQKTISKETHKKEIYPT